MDSFVPDPRELLAFAFDHDGEAITVLGFLRVRKRTNDAAGVFEVGHSSGLSRSTSKIFSAEPRSRAFPVKIRQNLRMILTDDNDSRTLPASAGPAATTPKGREQRLERLVSTRGQGFTTDNGLVSAGGRKATPTYFAAAAQRLNARSA
jgi:hypothetical protein